MNSPTEKKPQPPKLSPEETQNLLESCQQLDVAVKHLAAMRTQLERVLWLAVMQAGGTLILDESKVDPLWRMDRQRAPTGELILKAEKMDGPTDAQLDALCAALAGTDKKLFEAARDIGLDQFPPPFLQFRIAGRLLFVDGKWSDATLARQQAGQKPANN